jgi:penicillin amidase
VPLIAAGLMVAALLLAVLYFTLRASRPLLNGVRRVPGLGAEVLIRRDVAGVPAISGAQRADVALGLGLVHAQERFFQMDLCRRAAAGELAEILGPRFIGADRSARLHQFRRRAHTVMAGIDADERQILEAYCRGVNEGLRNLRGRPYEYWLTRSKPAAWQLEDTALIVFYMYGLLQDADGDRQFNQHLQYQAMPAIVADFLSPQGHCEWEAPMSGEPEPDPPIPAAHIFDLRREKPLRHLAAAPLAAGSRNGSNAWAIDRYASGTGRAIVANDMHLDFAFPAPFFRACMKVGDTRTGMLCGMTLPGFPFLIAGSNGAVAWGLANGAAHCVDLVRLDQSGLSRNEYRTPRGIKKLVTETELIRVRGAAPSELQVHSTPWGPIVREARDGTRFCQLWVAHFPQAVNFSWTRLETAGSAAEALDAANGLGVPALGITVADKAGEVGWTLAGPLPQRVAGRLPLVSSQIESGWEGWLKGSEYPRVSSPAIRRVWSANARPLAPPKLPACLKDGSFVLGARAAQIRDRISATAVADEQAMLRIQLDDHAALLARWHTLLLEVLASSTDSSGARWQELGVLLAAWDGRASAESAAYSFIRRFRAATEQRVFEPFISIVARSQGRFNFDSTTEHAEGSLWRLVTERPLHLLAPWFGSWEQLLISAVEETMNVASAQTWGCENQLAMRHPLSADFRLVRMLIDARAAPLSGDLNVPLAQTAGHGPVFRLVVSPGHERDAILHMPGGQAAHPLAPYFFAGHDAWLRGRPTPLLPGSPRYVLSLLPA